MKRIVYLVLSLAALAAPARAGCPPYRAAYHAPYYPPAYKYVVLFQVGVEARAEAIAQDAADKAAAKYKSELAALKQQLTSFKGRASVEFSGTVSADGEGTAYSEDRPAAKSGTPLAYRSCLECHDAQHAEDLGNGYKFPDDFSRLTAGQKAKIHNRLITTDPTRNMAVRAKLTDEEHEELVRALK